ncbi:Tetraspanin [Mactra antiquata]
MSFLTGLCRVFIVVVNIFFLLIGLAFFGLGLFLRFGSAIINDYIDSVKQQLEASATDSTVGTLDLSNFDISEMLFGLALGLIFFGLFLIIITVFGCCGGCCKIKWMLIAYVVICGVLLIAQIVVIGILYGSPDTFHDPAKQKLVDQIQSDYVGLLGTDIVSMGWNVIMQQMKCCGVNDYKDFTGAAKWVIDYSSVGTGYTLMTPLSCCKTLPSSDDLSCAAIGTATETNNYLNTGCYDEIWDIALGNQSIMIGVLVGVGVFQIALIVIGILLLLEIRKNKTTPNED